MCVCVCPPTFLYLCCNIATCNILQMEAAARSWIRGIRLSSGKTWDWEQMWVIRVGGCFWSTTCTTHEDNWNSAVEKLNVILLKVIIETDVKRGGGAIKFSWPDLTLTLYKLNITWISWNVCRVDLQPACQSPGRPVSWRGCVFFKWTGKLPFLHIIVLLPYNSLSYHFYSWFQKNVITKIY